MSQKIDTLIINSQSQLDSLPFAFPNGNIDARQVIITGNKIQNIKAFHHITHITGSLIIENILLDSITGIEHLFLNDDFRLEHNKNLVWVEKFLNLKKISTFKILNCPSLKDLDFIQNLEQIFTITLEGNTQNLKKIDNFHSLKYLYRFSLLDNTGIDSVLFYNNLGDVSVNLIKNENLTYFKVFNGTNSNTISEHTSSSDVFVFENKNLSYLEFSNSNLTFSSVIISSNPQLTTLKVGEKAINVHSIFELTNNPNLENFDGFNETTLADIIIISQNDKLKSLICFKMLKKTLNLSISNVNSLKNLGGSFSKLDTIGSISILRSGLYISGNRSLNSIEEFANLKFINSFTITNNKRLGLCSIKSICDHINAGRPFKVDADNYPGCRSKNQILAACVSEIEDADVRKKLNISPNPATSIINLNTYDFQEIELMYIISSDGNFIRLHPEKLETTISISSLPVGNFWVVYKIGDKIEKSNFIKI